MRCEAGPSGMVSRLAAEPVAGWGEVVVVPPLEPRPSSRLGRFLLAAVEPGSLSLLWPLAGADTALRGHAPLSPLLPCRRAMAGRGTACGAAPTCGSDARGGARGTGLRSGACWEASSGSWGTLLRSGNEVRWGAEKPLGTGASSSLWPWLLPASPDPSDPGAAPPNPLLLSRSRSACRSMLPREPPSPPLPSAAPPARPAEASGRGATSGTGSRGEMAGCRLSYSTPVCDTAGPSGAGATGLTPLCDARAMACAPVLDTLRTVGWPGADTRAEGVRARVGTRAPPPGDSTPRLSSRPPPAPTASCVAVRDRASLDDDVRPSVRPPEPRSSDGLGGRCASWLCAPGLTLAGAPRP
mmetsp:Transcript_218/g.499  ORF Transcript_218/g.499 Transcript_218/m.499 type:complete len:355 (-) Transcript_218:544-1608(-)